MVEETQLSSSVTITRYPEMESRSDREGIADFILERFSERYIRHHQDLVIYYFCTIWKWRKTMCKYRSIIENPEK